ncbi:MAG: hypothetical protein SVR08_14260, partial [Spirochaetota bacterium]|nr:hypothetical protein [Spirochaetota bacterium]
LIRYFGLYSSKSKGKWQEWDHVANHAPDGWREQNGLEKLEYDGGIHETCNVDDVSHKQSQASWARLIAKIYEIDLPYMDVPMPAVTGGEGAGL